MLYEDAIEEWRRAEHEAATAELAVVEMDLQHLPLAREQRDRVAELRCVARHKREIVYRAGLV